MFIFASLVGLAGLLAIIAGLYLVRHSHRIRLRPGIEAHFGAVGRQRLRWVVVLAYFVVGLSLLGAAWLVE